jgi:molybdenum cofactor guanylyltransferase
LGGQSLLVRLCVVLRDVVPVVTTIGDATKYAWSGVGCIADRWPGEGPLGGIVTALQASERSHEGAGARWNLIVGCDMPFLSLEWLTYLIERAVASSADVVVPESKHGLEPLCACWRTSVRPALQGVFEQGTRRVTDAMKHLRMEILDETHWKRFDSAERLFWNMNTPADYDEAKRILEAGQA